MPESATLATPQEALDLAVTRIGGQSAMARLCGVSQSTVWEWLNGGKELPAEHVLKVEFATHISRSDLRPDIYPRGLQDGVPFNADPLEGPLAQSSPEEPDGGKDDDSDVPERDAKEQAA